MITQTGLHRRRHPKCLVDAREVVLVVLPRVGGETRDKTKAYWTESVLELGLAVAVGDDLPLQLASDTSAESAQ